MAKKTKKRRKKPKKTKKTKKNIRRKKTKKLIKRKIRRVKKSAKRAVRKRRKKPRKKQARKLVKKKIRKVKRIKRLTKKKKLAKKIKRTKKRKKIRKKPLRRKAVKRTKKHRKRIILRRAKKIVRRTKGKYSRGSSLEQLFESPAKVQIMKLFFRNPETNFLLKEASRATRINPSLIKKQMKKLEKIGFLKSRRISSRKQLFSINPNFDFFSELKELILRSSPISKDRLLKAARGLGRIKLVLLSGVFVNNNTSRADLLIVGDNINLRKLNGFIKNLEAEAGTSINCVIMTTEEFKYRYDMYDRFVRDLLSDKNELLVNKLGL